MDNSGIHLNQLCFNENKFCENNRTLIINTIVLKGGVQYRYTSVQKMSEKMKNKNYDSSEWILIIMLLVNLAILLRAILSLWGYSGEGVPPMYGDFEAQRHWMELTIHLPIGDWYRQTKENNLYYWGLDYPPLTAYTSKIFGHWFAWLHPPLVEWIVSRGYESKDGKFFMRLSVILFDCIVYIPVVIWIGLRWFYRSVTHYKETLLAFPSSPSTWKIIPTIQTALVLITPGLLLIDHGHFQYNGVCIGLALAGAQLIVEGYDLLGSLFFSLSLNYKQMSLYYALIFFVVLLRKCFLQRTWFRRVMKLIAIGSTVFLTFAVLWLPFCLFHSPEETCVSSLLHVLSRQFPFARGIFEDKVANLWYLFSRVIDFRRFLSTTLLLSFSLFLTLALIAPVAIYLFFHPLTTKRMYLGMFCGALAFFLASFQVLLQF